jgi:hypothetical protein
MSGAKERCEVLDETGSLRKTERPLLIFKQSMCAQKHHRPLGDGSFNVNPAGPVRCKTYRNAAANAFRSQASRLGDIEFVGAGTLNNVDIGHVLPQ